MRGELDRETGEIRAYAYKTVVESPELVEDPLNQINLEDARGIAPEVEVGGELRYYKPTDVLGRIAAQMAKQIIFQKVREAERDTVFQRICAPRGRGVERHREADRRPGRHLRHRQSRSADAEAGAVAAGTVLPWASGCGWFCCGWTAMLAGRRWLSPGPPRSWCRTCSRAKCRRFTTARWRFAPLLAKPASGRRSPWFRRDKDVDPVGACVGMKGMRVQSIIRELRGEKIDIIEFSEEITTFAEKALQPAKVSRVSIIDLADKQIEVIVDDTQLSLAIGKKGQNVRLAAKLLGWKIDIKSEEEKRQEVEQQMQAMAGPVTTPIEQVTELGEGTIQKLIAAGITTVEGLADMTPEELEEVPGIGEKTLEKIGTAVRHYFAQLDAGRYGCRPLDRRETSEAEDTNEAALDREAGAGSDCSKRMKSDEADAAESEERQTLGAR